MPRNIVYILPEKLYIKDPQESEFGRRILRYSIDLLYDLGLKKFTFKKLATQMNSVEASIYRYFENKHLLLLYLTAWYWEWVHYVIDHNIQNITDPETRLRKAIHSIVFASMESDLNAYVNENRLHQVIVREGAKAYHVNEVDQENQEGLYKGYKELVNKVRDILKSINPHYPFAHSLASTIFETSLAQLYFAEHLPKLTDICADEKQYCKLEDFLFQMVYGALTEDSKQIVS